MASETSTKIEVQLELTEVETKLRQLLLDVAAYIDEQPTSKATAVEAPESLANEKIVLRWTGGWVRDKLLKVGSHDIDLAINKMTGEHFGLKLQEYLEIPGNAEKHGLIEKSDKTDKLSSRDKAKRVAPGLHKIEANPEKSKNLETATTNIMGIDLDLVNLRKETYNEISRNPQMEFGTAEEDAVRRDATVNAMFFNLHTCQVEDFTGQGFDDMAAKIIRTPLEPVQTFKDDPLRVLRLIRFASRLDYTIEPETEKAMANPEIQDVLKIKISRERVGIELEKMLKGPRPRMALELINRFGLYRTVFTDPTRELPAEPDTSLFQPAFEFVDSIVHGGSKTSVIADHLLRNADEQYLAWICATMIPWADAPTVPHQKPLQRPYFSAYLVAREGFKAPNKVCDVVAASLSSSEEIRNLVAQCARGLQRPDTINPLSDATARDTLGMAIRRWGSTWRTQVLFNLIYEVVLGNTSQEQLLRSYSSFLSHLAKLEILDADTFKPLLKGTDLAKALSIKPGPWMKDALDIVMAWQLREPSTTDPAEAIEAVKKARESDSELPQRLASHFLKLTIPPFFPQTKSTNTFEVSQKPALWKDPHNEFVLCLLGWSISALDRKAIEQNWHLLVPPTLKILDDTEAKSKARGCQLLSQLLLTLELGTERESDTPSSSSRFNSGFATQTSAAFLARTGYHEVFASTLWPLLTYIPSLTPEAESVTIFKYVYNPLSSLAVLSTTPDKRNKFLDKLMREGVLAPLSHFPTPSTYPSLARQILHQIGEIATLLEIETVKHLPSLIPLLTSIMHDPFILSHKELTLAAVVAMQALVQTCWPRIPAHRGAITLGLCVLKGRIDEEIGGEEKADEENRDWVLIRTIREELRDTAECLDAALSQSEVKDEWEMEKRELAEADGGLVGFFEEKAVE
ncbi:tRNA nucleotidyltransferase [Macroventuria anomochaeta]|uniref:tRNA nucleotidyltransferase n=1 Tax=Macroventuria anomochaeta TaxID=301207 RepID=A0ACB6SAQ9_9PLEO|nr:tRNA nucleotidyltransferase [Macroventuria anomochaeta]KAF2631128.1 tRNA nucleotidyltransferase [Macroventuria anomochaeta]